MHEISEKQKADLFRELAVDLYKTIRDSDNAPKMRKSDAYITAEAQLLYLRLIDVVDEDDK